ncbi:MAG: hypothetical protein MK096_13385 [Oleiphilaceae bacterium]|nr:hypothetical protein [Oleiphilaceae bacterium]
MSNESIKKRIEESLTKFEIGELNLNALKESIELNGQALESMPYDLIKDIDEIEYQLTQCAFADEEDCQYDVATTISFIKNWLSKVPS